MNTSTIRGLQVSLRKITVFQIFLILTPILIGIVLGLFVSYGDWHYAFGLALILPFVVLLTSNPFIGVIIWLLLMPLFSGFPNPDIMYWAIHRILVPLTLFAMLVPYILRSHGNLRIRFGIPEFGILLVAVWVLGSIIISPTTTRWTWIKYVDCFLIPFCMYLIVRLSPLDFNENEILTWAVVFVAVIQITIGSLSWAQPDLLPRAWHRLVGLRTAGSLSDPAVFTSLLVFCATILFQKATHCRPGVKRLLFLLVCGASFLFVFLSLERGSWLAGVLVLIGMVALYPKTMVRFLLIFLVISIVLGSGLLSKQVSMATQRMAASRPIESRIVVTDAMLQMIQEKPLFGWGFDTINRNIMWFYRQVGAANLGNTFITSHNTYLTIFTELGLVGFVAYLLPAYFLFVASLRTWRKLPKEERSSRLLLWAFWLGALQNFIVSNFVDMRFSQIGLTLWWMSLGFIASILIDRSIIPATKDRFIPSPVPPGDRFPL